MTAFGVSGTHRLLTEKEKQYVHRIVKRALLPSQRRGMPSLHTTNTLASGVQWGVDTEAVLAVWGLIPFENLILVTPGIAQHNYGLVERAAANGAQIIKGPTLHTVRETYLARDDIVVEKLRVLLAFPQRPTFYRSGTWATINRARKADRKVRLYPLVNA